MLRLKGNDYSSYFSKVSEALNTFHKIETQGIKDPREKIRNIIHLNNVHNILKAFECYDSNSPMLSKSFKPLDYLNQCTKELTKTPKYSIVNKQYKNNLKGKVHYSIFRYKRKSSKKNKNIAKQITFLPSIMRNSKIVPLNNNYSIDPTTKNPLLESKSFLGRDNQIMRDVNSEDFEPIQLELHKKRMSNI